MSKQKYSIGVDIGGTYIKVGAASEEGTIIHKTRVDTRADEGPEIVIRQIIKGVKRILEKNNSDIEGIGIGAPGSVIKEKGMVLNPPNLPGWKRVELGPRIAQEFNTRVSVDNDANAAAVGEMIFGAGKDLNHFLMITLGTGVGGGVVINRKVFGGELGAAGEIGHTTVDYKGRKCNCGSYGCLETYIGNNYLIKHLLRELKKNDDSKIHELINGDYSELSTKIVHEAAQMKDELAIKTIISSGRILGYGIASTVNLLDMSNVVIGGGVAGFGKLLFDSVESAIKERVLTPLKPRIKVIPAELKNEAGIKGASALIFC